MKQTLQALKQRDVRLYVDCKPAGRCSVADAFDKERPSSATLLSTLRKDMVPLHRIDRWTSGILLFGSMSTKIRGRRTDLAIRDNWHNAVSKSYLAIIRTPSWMVNECDLPLQDHPGEAFKTCKTGFKVLSSFGGYSLVQCDLLQNGRMHQIRKHLKQLGSPIVGDTKYGGEKSPHRRGQLLHAWKLRLELPDLPQSFQAPIPWEFFKYLPDGILNELDRSANEVQTMEVELEGK